MYYTYILISKNEKRTYTGSTGDLARRVEEHNAGKVFSTKPYRPYEVLHCEEFLTLKEARGRESFFKSTSGRRQIIQFVKVLELS